MPLLNEGVLLYMLVYPALFALWKGRALAAGGGRLGGRVEAT